MTEQERIEHNRLFQEASALVWPEIPLHDRPALPAPGWWLRRKLNRALSMFDRVLALKPTNWSAMWVVGKVQQRLGDEAAALNWFEKSWQAHPSHPDVAREASLSAMHLGRSDLAIVYAHHAAQLDPQSAGLQANLALAYLLAGQLQQAQTNIDLSLKADPADPISKSVQAIIKHFASTRQPPPKTLQELQVYWSKHTSK